MNWQHFQAILWLRWRLSANQLRKGGTLGVVLSILLVSFAVMMSSAMFVGGLAVGWFAMAKIDPVMLMVAWDVVIVAFLFFWMLGLLSELQRSESLSMDKLLHLPVSLSGTFLLNYCSSLFNLSMVIWAPGMVGLSLGLILRRGPTMLLLLPLVASFLLMISAVTYQFRGWLATIIVNKRRRRTVIAAVTMFFILLGQVPNLLNLTVFRKQREARQAAEKKVVDDLQQALSSGKLTTAEHTERLRQIQEEKREKRARDRQLLTSRIEEYGGIVNLALPPGWLAYGAQAALRGQLLPPLLCSLGGLLVAACSLRRSYRTTVRHYTGSIQKRRRQAAPTAVASPASPGAGGFPAEPQANFLERRIPGLNPQAQVIALATFRSLARAPEVKLVLLTPLILVVVFSSLLFSGTIANVPPSLRPAGGLFAVTVTMFGLVQLLQNQFGYDRDAFRALVLAPVQRRDILLGKNLAVVPMALSMNLLALVALQVFLPMRASHFIASLLQLVPIYLMFCCVANLISILAPVPVAAGSLNPSRPKITTVLIHMLGMFLFPLALLPTTIPLGIELLVNRLLKTHESFIYLGLSIVVLLPTIWLYGKLLTAQGKFLQSREQRILEIVTSKIE